MTHLQTARATLLVFLTIGLTWYGIHQIDSLQAWEKVVLGVVSTIFSIVILSALSKTILKLIEQKLFIKIANLLHDSNQSLNQDYKASGLPVLMLKAALHQVSIFMLLVSLLLYYLSNDHLYIFILLTYWILSIAIVISIKNSESATDNHFQNTEGLYFEIVALCILLPISMLFQSTNEIKLVNTYQKIIPLTSINSVYEPSTSNSFAKSSNVFLSVPNMELYSLDQLNKINFDRFINDRSYCAVDDCNLGIEKIAQSEYTTNGATHDALLCKINNQNVKNQSALFADTSDKQYFYLTIDKQRSNIFWVENHIIPPEHWVLFIAILSIALVLIGSVIKILAIFNARRDKNTSKFYAEKIFNVLQYANTYHAYSTDGIATIIKEDLTKSIIGRDSHTSDALLDKNKANTISKIQKTLLSEKMPIMEEYKDESLPELKNNKTYCEAQQCIQEVAEAESFLHTLITKIDEQIQNLKKENRDLRKEELIKKEITLEVISLNQKLKKNPDDKAVYLAFVLYTIQDIFLPRYEQLSDNYINQNLLPYAKTHRQKVDIDFRDCSPDADYTNVGLHAGSLVDVDPHARLIKFIIDAIVYSLIGYCLTVLYSHQWLPTEVAVISSIAAAIMYLNKDWLKNLITGYVIWRDKLISLGEWIQIPEKGINGHVIDITQSNIKIQNYSGTEVSMPLQDVVKEPFRSFNSAKKQGHRIKRNFLFDIHSVHLTTIEEIHATIKSAHPNNIDKFNSMKNKITESYNIRNAGSSKFQVRQTNLEIFRRYMTEYLLDQPYINNKELLMVRELDLTEYGVPIEIYAFVEPMLAVYKNGENKSKCIRHYDRAIFESIQSEIIEHVIWSSKYFGIKIFQAESDQQHEKDIL